MTDNENKDILFSDKPKFKKLNDAFGLVVAELIAAHETEADKVRMIETLISDSFQKCLMCRMDGNSLNLAAIIHCVNIECPLRETNSKLTARVAQALGYQVELPGNGIQ